MSDKWKPTLITAAVLLVGGAVVLGLHWSNLNQGHDPFTGTYTCARSGGESPIRIDEQKRLFLGDKETGHLRVTAENEASLDFSEEWMKSASDWLNPIAKYHFRAAGENLFVAGLKDGSTLFSFNCHR